MRFGLLGFGQCEILGYCAQWCGKVAAACGEELFWVVVVSCAEFVWFIVCEMNFCLFSC